MNRREKIFSVLLGLLVVMLLSSVFLLQDWSKIGHKAEEGELVEGPAVVRPSPSEDKIFALKDGGAIEVRGGEIIFYNFSEKDLEGWEIISFP